MILYHRVCLLVSQPEYLIGKYVARMRQEICLYDRQVLVGDHLLLL